jgi:hypothetical protein
MRALAAWIVALGLVASPAMAGTGVAGDKESPAAASATSASSTAAQPGNAPVAAARPAESSVAAELQQLRDLLEAQAKQLEEQQQKMAELEAALHAVKAEPVAAAVPAASAIAPAAQAPQDLGKRLDGLEARIKSIGPFSLGGDLRLRDEPFFGGPTNQSQVRNRERFRLRLDLNAKLNDDISGGIRLTSGDTNNPLTGNQTLTNFYAKKPFNLDRVFIKYTPHQFKPLTLTGGKFEYPFYRTELVWDNDLNPEGLAQKLEWKSDKWTLLRQFAFVGFELPFAEVASNLATNKSVRQSVVYGGQIQTKWQLGSWLSMTLDSAFYNYHNPDPIALALLQASSSNPQTPDVGLLPLAGPSLQNSVTKITKTTIVTADVGIPPAPIVLTALPTGVTTITSAQFASKFALSDTIAQFDIKTPAAAWPIRFLADYVQNTRACANVPNIPTVAPANTSTATFALSTSATCRPKDRRGHWLEARFGRQAEKGDWQFAYTHMLIEREAVMGAVNFDDMRQNTNVLQNRVEVFYNAYKNVTLGFTGLFGRPLASTEPYLKRMQFDVVYKF